MLSRLLWTVAATVVFGVLQSGFGTYRMLDLGQSAGAQFSNSDGAYLGFTAKHSLYQGVGGLISLAFVVVLALIWFVPAREWIKKAFTAMLGLTVVGVLVQPQPALAYYDKSDYTEAYTILPNESAFWIPSVGNNKDTQVRAETEDFFNQNKVFAKMFVVPHATLSGSGLFSNFYVPTGRLIIVDRAPYSREWVDAHDRGTSATKQGFPCQSREGLDITVGLSIGVSVLEDNAAKYLYRFGVVAPKGNRNDPQIIFQSVYYGRDLANVMDDVGRKAVQTMVCEEISARSFDKANEEAPAIMKVVKEKAKAYFAEVGIRLDFLGWANTFEFDPKVQDAVNRVYIAAQDRKIADMLQPVVGVLLTVAQADAIRGWGKNATGNLPYVVGGGSSSVTDLVGAMIVGPAMPKPEQVQSPMRITPVPSK